MLVLFFTHLSWLRQFAIAAGKSAAQQAILIHGGATFRCSCFEVGCGRNIMGWREEWVADPEPQVALVRFRFPTRFSVCCSSLIILRVN